MGYDDLLERVGSFGPYQIKLFAIFSANAIPNALMLTSLVFLHYIPDHHCSVQQLTSQGFLSNASRRYIPIDDTTQMHSNCLMYNLTGKQQLNTSLSELNLDNRTVSCTSGYEYEQSIDIQSAMMEFNAVCEQDWYKPFISALYMSGMAVGTLSGFISDRFGRRPVFLVATLLQFSTTFLSSFALGVRSYAGLIFLCGLTQIVNYMAAFVLGTECTSPKGRNFISISGFLSFSVGYMIGPLLAYLIPNWRWFLRVNGLIGLLYIPMYWLIPESPRWLIAKGKIEEAKAQLMEIAAKNGKLNNMNEETLALVNQDLVKNDEDKISNSTWKPLFEMVRRPAMLGLVFVISFSWLATAIVYFGISLSAQTLHGNLYINCLLLGAIEIPGLAAAYLAVQYFSRPKMHAFFMMTAGVCCLTAAFLKNYRVATFVVSLIGKAANSGVFYLVYIHTAEIASTLTRNSLMCVGSAAGRIGSVAAPFFVYAVDLHGYFAPYLMLSGISLLSAFLTFLFLPETRLKVLPETVDDTLKMQTVFNTHCQWMSCRRRKTNSHLDHELSSFEKQTSGIPL